MKLTPNWLTCEHRDGCEGIRWTDGRLCLAHLDGPEQADALGLLRPGSHVDLRGTHISTRLLVKLLKALTPEAADAVPRFGTARFRGAHFTGGVRFARAYFGGDAWFDGAQFREPVTFDGAHFAGAARFGGAQFGGDVRFVDARFAKTTRFDGVQFDKEARFDKAQFSGYTRFGAARFHGAARFGRTQFAAGVRFDEAQFSGFAQFGGAQFSEATFDDARFAEAVRLTATRFSRVAEFVGTQFNGSALFSSARFETNARFDQARFGGSLTGPLVCQGMVSARQAEFARSMRLQVAAREVNLVGARFAAPCVLAVRYAAVNLTDVAADAPVTVTSHPVPLVVPQRGTPLDERGLPEDVRASVTSLTGADAAKIVLNDVDLSECVFSGAHNLDQLRLEGRPQFAEAPRGWHWGPALIPARRWTRRKVLAEEAAWRVATQRGPSIARAGWTRTVPPIRPASPAQLAVLYRQLRKALEDGKNTPGAADFYYGEMEARRHDKEGTPSGERWLLFAYWLVSGYALRASRALGFLAVSAAVTFLLMVTLGLPNNQLNPVTSGFIPVNGGHVTLTSSTPDPVLTLPLGQRFTVTRADQAGLVVVNAVVFRSTDATLTGPGTWIDITSRIVEPVLLGFAAVAARGRVQR